jgi:hypothetical protein
MPRRRFGRPHAQYLTEPRRSQGTSRRRRPRPRSGWVGRERLGIPTPTLSRTTARVSSIEDEHVRMQPTATSPKPQLLTPVEQCARPKWTTWGK